MPGGLKAKPAIPPAAAEPFTSPDDHADWAAVGSVPAVRGSRKSRLMFAEGEAGYPPGPVLSSRRFARGTLIRAAPSRQDARALASRVPPSLADGRRSDYTVFVAGFGPDREAHQES